MPLVQFELDHKRLMARFKKVPDKDTSKVLLVMDNLAKQLAAKGLQPNNRDSLVNKLKDAMKKVKRVITEDIKKREKLHAQTVLKPPEGFDAQGAMRTMNNIKRELRAIEKKAQAFTDSGGAPPPPPKLPELHYGADYKKLIVENDGMLSPSVVVALDRLDETSDPVRAIDLTKAVRVALDGQIALLSAEAGKARDPKEKMRLTKLVKELTEFRGVIKTFEIRVFLFNKSNPTFAKDKKKAEAAKKG